MIQDSYQFKGNTKLRAQWQAPSYVLNPGSITTWNGFRLLGWFCPGSSIKPTSINGHSISQLIASDNWDEEYQCGLYCPGLTKDVTLTIPGCGSYTLKYSSSYRYIHFLTKKQCTEVYNFFKAYQNSEIGIYLDV